MKILVLIHEFPPVGGGGGRAAQDLCRGLAERGHEITVLTAHLKGLPQAETEDGIRILRLPSMRREAFRADLIAMGGYVLSGLWAGYRYIKHWHPDMLHVHFAVPAGALAWTLSRWTGVPYALTVHLGDVPGGVPEKTEKWFKWVQPFTQPIWRDARHVVAVSEFTRQLALKHYTREIEVIPNGVDMDRLRPAGIQVNEPPRIVFAGRFMVQKNPLQIVHTLAELKDLSWQCVMLGDGPLMPDVQQAILEYGLQERFTLPGWVTPEEVLTWFDRSDILFMPSHSEGLPVVGVQALAKGLALVVSKIGGFVDLVAEGQSGFLVDGNQPSGFSIALRQLLSHQDNLHRFREASLQKAIYFDIERMVEQYDRIFLTIDEVS
ncbi:MAG: glycosyltransferase family 4 protein [Anaerolineales bacterium]|nr:glycosyltransferase family 4 protein [Anaerolineales bacterium]